MNIQNDLKNVLKIFPKDKTELESQKIELALADDIKKKFALVDSLEDDLYRYAKMRQQDLQKIYSLKESLRDNIGISESRLKELSEVSSLLEGLKNKISQSAKELGINPKEVKFFTGIDSYLKSIKSIVKDFNGDVKEARKESKG